MSDLADRMRDAADTIEKANQRVGANPNYFWRPDALRREARHVEDEDQETDEREALVKELAQILHEAHIRGDYEHHARQIIAAGWRKDPTE